MHMHICLYIYILYTHVYDKYLRHVGHDTVCVFAFTNALNNETTDLSIWHLACTVLTLKTCRQIVTSVR